MADLTKAVGDQARIFDGLSLSSGTGSTTPFMKRNLLEELEAFKRQVELLLEANSALTLQLSDCQTSNRDLATRTVSLERMLQDIKTQVESSHSKGMAFQANVLEMLNNNRFGSSDGESGNSIRPFLTAAQLTKMCGFKWIVSESTPTQLSSLCRKLQEMSASSRMVAILRCCNLC